MNIRLSSDEIYSINVQGSLIYYLIYGKHESRLKIKLETVLTKMLDNLSSVVDIKGGEISINNLSPVIDIKDDEISIDNTINGNLLVISASGLHSIFHTFGEETGLSFICEDVIRTIKGENTHLTLVEKP